MFEGAGHAITLIIGHDQQHVWGTLGRHNGRRPIRLGVLRIFLDHAAELRRLRRKLLAIERHRSAGRPWRARDLLGREKAWQSDEQARQTGGQQESLIGFGDTHDIHPFCNDRLSDLKALPLRSGEIGHAGENATSAALSAAWRLRKSKTGAGIGCYKANRRSVTLRLPPRVSW
jgi:hypothetical protein